MHPRSLFSHIARLPQHNNQAELFSCAATSASPLRDVHLSASPTVVRIAYSGPNFASLPHFSASHFGLFVRRHPRRSLAHANRECQRQRQSRNTQSRPKANLILLRLGKHFPREFSVVDIASSPITSQKAMPRYNRLLMSPLAAAWRRRGMAVVM